MKKQMESCMKSWKRRNTKHVIHPWRFGGTGQIAIAPGKSPEAELYKSSTAISWTFEGSGVWRDSNPDSATPHPTQQHRTYSETLHPIQQPRARNSATLHPNIIVLLRHSGRAVYLYSTAHKTQNTMLYLEDFLHTSLFPDLLPQPIGGFFYNIFRG
jgi:hypothetical protein